LGLNPVAERWSDTAVALPSGRWSDLFTDASWTVDDQGPHPRSSGASDVLVGDLLARFPVALLERTD